MLRIITIKQLETEEHITLASERTRAKNTFKIRKQYVLCGERYHNRYVLRTLGEIPARLLFSHLHLSLIEMDRADP